jgi:hypothetical protein
MNEFENYPTLESQLYQRPDCYFGETHYGTATIYGRNRDSDLLTESNWNALLKIEGEGEHVYITRESHWLCGWVEFIRLRPSAPAHIKQQFEDALNSLPDYPVLDECDFSEREHEAVCEFWDSWEIDADEKPSRSALDNRLDAWRAFMRGREHWDRKKHNLPPLVAIRKPLYLLSEQYPEFEMFVEEYAR